MSDLQSNAPLSSDFDVWLIDQFSGLVRELSEQERLSFALALISTVRTETLFAEVAWVGHRIDDHASALLACLFDSDQNSGEGPDTGKATTHEQPGSSALSGGNSSSLATGKPAPRDTHPKGWRAAWEGFANAMTGEPDSLVSDFMAGVLASIAFGGLAFAMLLTGPF